MEYWRLIWRACFAIIYTLYIVGITALRKSLLQVGQDDALRIRRRWANVLLHTVGVRVKTEGEIPQFPGIIVCNHRSWIDPIVLLRDIEGIPVSMAEVANWPLLGKGAQLAGIIYLQRGHGGSSTSTLRAIADTVTKGRKPIIIFPEGTTSDLPGALEFKPGVFKLAARLGLPVTPTAILFDTPEDYWIGDEPFISNMIRRMGLRRMHIRVVYGMTITDSDPESLRQRAFDQVNRMIFEC